MIIHNKKYSPPLLLRNGHVHTVFASKIRKSVALPFDRVRWKTPDDDFIDIDFLKGNNPRIALIGHGLEGNSRRPYITNTADLFFKNGWDVCAWNSRSCSGEMNQQTKLYSHGDTNDLEFIIRQLSHSKKYDQILLIGFSMGGAIILNLLGKMGLGAPAKLMAGIAISTPLDIKAASKCLEQGVNTYYRDYFMDRLREKIKIKAEQHPGLLEVEGIDSIKKWREFDDRYSAPLGGFEDAEDFYFHCSAIHRLNKISIPTLLINAKDDPLLTIESYATSPFQDSDLLHALYTRKGGHVAFLQKGKKYSLAEEKALHFAQATSKGLTESFCKQSEKL